MINLDHEDLELAKSLLIEHNLNLVIVKNGNIIYKTKKQGINGFLYAIETLDENLNSSSIADTIVGVATAMLSVYANIKSIYAQTISESAIKILVLNNVKYQYDNKVSNILNRSKSDVCPFEKLAMNSKTIEEAYSKLRKCMINNK